jgi:S1-C subfamily serine protease
VIVAVIILLPLFVCLTVVDSEKPVVPTVYEMMTDSVVEIHGVDMFFRPWTASGVVLTEDGFIATAKHCVKGNLFFWCTIEDKEYIIDQWCANADSEAAVFKISAKGLVPARLAKEPLKLGQTVYGMGWAGGRFTDYLSKGIVSTVDHSDELVGDGILTDLNIEHGMSGGGLFTEQGELVGLLAAYYLGNKSLSVSAPIGQALELMENFTVGVE